MHDAGFGVRRVERVEAEYYGVVLLSKTAADVWAETTGLASCPDSPEHVPRVGEVSHRRWDELTKEQRSVFLGALCHNDLGDALTSFNAAQLSSDTFEGIALLCADHTLRPNDVPSGPMAEVRREMEDAIVAGCEVCPECAEDAGLYQIPDIGHLQDLLQYLEEHGVEARCWDL